MGTKRKPLSSRKARWAPSLLAFFYPWPFGTLPLGDGGFVSFPGLLLGLLTAPSQAGQDSPDVMGMVVDPELPPDYIRNPALRPEVGGIAAPHGSPQQEPRQPLGLALGQLGWPARHWLGPQPCLPSFLDLLAPHVHGTERTPDFGGDVHWAQSLCQPPHGAPPALLELLRTSIWSHAARIACFLLFMRISIVEIDEAALPMVR